MYTICLSFQSINVFFFFSKSDHCTIQCLILYEQSSYAISLCVSGAYLFSWNMSPCPVGGNYQEHFIWRKMIAVAQIEQILPQGMTGCSNSHNLDAITSLKKKNQSIELSLLSRLFAVILSWASKAVILSNRPLLKWLYRSVVVTGGSEQW